MPKGRSFTALAVTTQTNRRFKMDYTQNAKIAQVTEKSLVIGADVGSGMHYARAFNWRGQELSKKAFSFGNDLVGYLAFTKWLDGYREPHHPSINAMDGASETLALGLISTVRPGLRR